jgi:uncharacterized protein
MPTIRDLVAAVRERDGVDAAVVLGRDGLLIDSQTIPSLEAENVAAHVPGIVSAADEFGSATVRGDLTTAVMEYPNGLAIISVLSADAILLVLVQPRANVGQLLFELRRHREQIALLV